MFPPEIRGLGVGLSYAVGRAIQGGSAQDVVLGLKSLGVEEYSYIHVSIMCGVALAVCLLPDLRKVSNLNDED